MNDPDEQIDIHLKWMVLMSSTNIVVLEAYTTLKDILTKIATWHRMSPSLTRSVDVVMGSSVEQTSCKPFSYRFSTHGENGLVIALISHVLTICIKGSDA